MLRLTAAEWNILILLTGLFAGLVIGYVVGIWNMNNQVNMWRRRFEERWEAAHGKPTTGRSSGKVIDIRLKKQRDRQ